MATSVFMAVSRQSLLLSLRNLPISLAAQALSSSLSIATHVSSPVHLIIVAPLSAAESNSLPLIKK